jgi:hypothetical protein
MNTAMLLVFLASLAGFTGLYYWMWKVYVKVEQLRRRIQQPTGG